MQYERRRLSPTFHTTLSLCKQRRQAWHGGRTHRGPPAPAPAPPPPPDGKALPSNKNISLQVYILWLASLMSSQHPKRWLLAFLPCAGVPVSFELWLQTCSSQGAPLHHSAGQKLLSQWHCRLGKLNTFPGPGASQTLPRGSTAVLSPIYPQGKAIPCCSFQNGATATLLRKRSSLVQSQQAETSSKPRRAQAQEGSSGTTDANFPVLVNGKARLGSRDGRREQFTFDIPAVHTAWPPLKGTLGISAFRDWRNQRNQCGIHRDGSAELLATASL